MLSSEEMAGIGTMLSETHTLVAAGLPDDLPQKAAEDRKQAGLEPTARSPLQEQAQHLVTTGAAASSDVPAVESALRANRALYSALWAACKQLHLGDAMDDAALEACYKVCKRPITDGLLVNACSSGLALCMCEPQHGFLNTLVRPGKCCIALLMRSKPSRTGTRKGPTTAEVLPHVLLVMLYATDHTPHTAKHVLACEACKVLHAPT